MRQGPRDDVVGVASGPKQLRVRWRYVIFYSIVERESVRSPVRIQTFLRCLGHEGFVRRGKRVECLDGNAQSVDESSLGARCVGVCVPGYL